MGRTEMRVSLLGQGGGGPSQLGQRTDVDQPGIDRLIAAGIEAGINFFDTAESYGESEVILGQALAGVERDRYFLASKVSYKNRRGDGRIINAKELVERLDRSLERLGTDYLDLYQMHGLEAGDVGPVLSDLIPELERQRRAGRIRAIGVSELWEVDGPHEALLKCLPDGPFDTTMVGYNLLNSCAEDALFDVCREHDIGVIVMFAVRRAMSDAARRNEIFAELVKDGSLDPDSVDAADPLGWVLRDGVGSIPEAAYRFALEPNVVGTVLTGTSKIEHLRHNLAAVAAGPLPPDLRREIRERYGQLTQSLGT
ncbi:MAG: aldo/keto reductase [Chloroflexota bacterium]|nr:aldo/keto reductase [Chloroflexota bacterium]